MKKILLLLASVAVLFSCGNKGDNTDPVVPTPEEQASLTVDVTELSFVAEGEAKTIKISTNKDWKVSTTADWLDLSPESGVAGEDLSVNVTASANTTESVRTATVTIKADKLTKTVSISQEKPAQEPAPGPDQPGNATSYQRGTDPVMYASGLEDNKFYVLYSKYYDTEVWTESEGKLTMSENENIVFSAEYVFQFKKDDSKLNTTFDSYGNFAAGAWKSMSTGKYLDEDFNLNAELDNALYLEFANNWGSTNAPNEINVLDVYKCPITSTSTLSLWYHNDALVFGDNGYAYEGGQGTNKRKWVAYEVTAVAQ